MSAAKTLPDLIDCLLSDYKKPEDLIGEDSLLKQITKALVERAVEAIETILDFTRFCRHFSASSL